MRDFIQLMILVCLMNGCKVDTPPANQPISVSIEKNNTAILGVAKVSDERDTENVGNIGAVMFHFKKDELSEITTNYFIHYLNEKTKGRVTRVVGVESDNVSEITSKYQVNHIVFSKIRRLRIFSENRFTPLVKVELQLDLMVYNKKGRRVYQQTLNGSFNKKIRISIVEQDKERWFEAVFYEAMNELVKNPRLRLAMSRI